MDAKNMGVFIKGLVMAKQEYYPKNGSDPRYTINVAVPGTRINIPVSVDRSVYEKAIELSEFACRLSVSTFNGSTFFARAE